MNDFYKVAKKHCPSKLDMGYCRHLYSDYLLSRRDEPITLLELGIKHGDSLRMYEEYFPNGTIVGLDCLDRTKHAKGRVKVYVGRQEEEAVLSRICADHKMDFIVDDASHRGLQQIASFKYLFPRLAPKGIYFIEDLHFFVHKQAPDAWDMEDGHVTQHKFVEYIKSLFPFVIMKHRHHELIRANDLDRSIGPTIKAIHIHGKMIVVEKL